MLCSSGAGLASPIQFELESATAGCGFHSTPPPWLAPACEVHGSYVECEEELKVKEEEFHDPG